MNVTPDENASPEEIRRTVDSTRGEVDRTMDELEARLSVRRKVDNAREKLGTAAETARHQRQQQHRHQRNSARRA